jgi:hypothetical protein
MAMVVQELIDYMNTLEIIDTHEHLPNESERLKQQVDFSTLFSQYCQSDLFASGMDLNRFFSPEVDVEEKWNVFQPHYERIKNGSYARAARLAMERFYGLNDLRSVNDAYVITERIRDGNKPGLYKRVLKDACRLRTALNFGGMSVDREYFTPVEYMTHYTDVSSQDALESFAGELGVVPRTLSEYVDSLGEMLYRKKEQGLRGIKFQYAYMRDLAFESVTTADAERVFNRIFEESQGWRAQVLGYEERRPLQNYLVHRFVELAGKFDLTVVFHTGIQAGFRNKPDNARPERLWNLVNRYTNTRFVLLHSGIPWVEEAAMLAKYFANVYLDMAWMHIISPQISVRALSEWVDLVPRNKILGFGGDYHIVEKVYGHLTMAKENIAKVLAGKVEERIMTDEEARAWAKALLHDNPAEVYHLLGV